MLSRNFDLAEFVVSETAQRYGIENRPAPEKEHALKLLVDNVLQPLRDRYGYPIRVNSGYRCPELNRLVGGVATSQHVRGEAADITTGSVAENRRLLKLAQGLPFDQLIWEQDGAWIHVSYSQFGNRHQILAL